MPGRTAVPSARKRTLTERIDLGGVDDQISRTADRTRLPGGEVHALLSATSPRDADGRVYLTRCKAELHASHGAVLTTDPVTCGSCARYRKRGTRR